MLCRTSYSPARRDSLGLWRSKATLPAVIMRCWSAGPWGQAECENLLMFWLLPRSFFNFLNYGLFPVIRKAVLLLIMLTLEELNFWSYEGNHIASRKSEKRLISEFQADFQRCSGKKRERSWRGWQFRRSVTKTEVQCYSNEDQARLCPFVCMVAIKLTQQKCGGLELKQNVWTQPLCSELAKESMRLLGFSLPQKDLRR